MKVRISQNLTECSFFQKSPKKCGTWKMNNLFMGLIDSNFSLSARISRWLTTAISYGRRADDGVLMKVRGILHTHINDLCKHSQLIFLM